MKTKTEQRIQEIKAELRTLFENDNDAPRLIAEMLEEFPASRGPKSACGGQMTHNFG